ncbi:Cyclin-U3-1 [Porphyridium purpureum]|uniref:Cyclin-U3-1 n=1 Tax=Porphyridium purpureum TaxID=35688 RepID=A0A5J4YSC5_PORPP|nr:Cyclin-U3-1 [Porphyridium purpureum]|eukprot:POR1773..scf236_6
MRSRKDTMLLDDCTLAGHSVELELGGPAGGRLAARVAAKRKWTRAGSGVHAAWSSAAWRLAAPAAGAWALGSEETFSEPEDDADAELDFCDDGFDAAFLDDVPQQFSNITTPDSCALNRSFKVARSESVSSVAAGRHKGHASSGTLERSPLTASATPRPGRLSRCLSCLEERLRAKLEQNDEDPELDNVCSEFHRPLPHGVSGMDVFRTINTLTSTPASMVAALLLLERLETKARKFRLCSANVRSLLLVAVLLVEKCYNDRCKLVNTFARAGGLDARQLCHLEMTMLVSLNFRLGITRQVFEEYEAKLLEQGQASELEPSLAHGLSQYNASSCTSL